MIGVILLCYKKILLTLHSASGRGIINDEQRELQGFAEEFAASYDEKKTLDIRYFLLLER